MSAELGRRSKSLRLAGWLLIAFTLASARGAANAQVLEIGADGASRWLPSTTVSAAPAAKGRLAPRLHAGVITEAAATADLSAALVEAVARQESGLRPDRVSPKGALGEMQLMPATARALGVDPRDPRQNVFGGARYLKALMRRYDGDIVRTLAAYNAGPGAVDRYGGPPPFRETQKYVASILERLSRQAEQQESAR